jgi:hypothetical protein
MIAFTDSTMVSELISRMNEVIEVNGMSKWSDILSVFPASPGISPGRFL